MEKWILKNKCSNYKELADIAGVSDIIAKIVTNRGHNTLELLKNYISPNENLQYDPYLFLGMSKAIDVTVDAINSKKKIAIVGDYDVDGIMSSAILYKIIKSCGGDVKNIIPDRFLDGYGINENIIADLCMLDIDLIITCDNGVSAFEAVNAAKDEGMDIIVIDHHEFKYEKDESGNKKICLVNADVIINPHNPNCTYPFKKLCAGYISYKFAVALSEAFNIPIENDLMIFSAIATICDVVDLVDENRYIVRTALKNMSELKNIGLNELIKANNLDKNNLSSYHIGFVIGPCLNASGRLESAMLALQLLVTEDQQIAESLSNKLVELNIERRALTDKGVDEANLQALGNNDTIKVLYLPNTHESVAGIIAGRMKEKYYHPFIILTDSQENGLKGSARSIEEISIIREISKCDHLLEKYGGHPMAAGLSLKRENLSEFITLVNQNYLNFKPEKSILVDYILPFSHIDERLISEINALEPFGKGNEKPVLAQIGVSVLTYREIGKEKQFLKMELKDKTGIKIEGLYFGNKKEELLEAIRNKNNLDLLFTVSKNEYMGKTKVQIIVDNYRISEYKA